MDDLGAPLVPLVAEASGIPCHPSSWRSVTGWMACWPPSIALWAWAWAMCHQHQDWWPDGDGKRERERERERVMWLDVDLWIGGSSNLEVSWCLGPRCGLFPVDWVEDAEALHPGWPFGVLQHLKGGISMQHQSASVSCLPFVTQESSSNLPDLWHSWIVSVQLCRCMPSRTWICVEDQFGGFLRWK